MITWAEFGMASAAWFGLMIFCYVTAAIICYLPKEKIRRKRNLRKIERQKRTQWMKDDEDRCPDWADPKLWQRSLR